jgi:hypothetical protein
MCIRNYFTSIVHLMTFSVAQTILCKIWRLINNELENILNEAFVA